MNCSKCGTLLIDANDVTGFCPKCRLLQSGVEEGVIADDSELEEPSEIIEPKVPNLPKHLEGSILKEYKVISQRDHWFTSNFDKDTMEDVLNQFAAGGWRLVTAETVVYGTGGFGGNREELYFFMERDRPSS